jgi:hypothetical protein
LGGIYKNTSGILAFDLDYMIVSMPPGGLAFKDLEFVLDRMICSGVSFVLFLNDLP